MGFQLETRSADKQGRVSCFRPVTILLLRWVACKAVNKCFFGVGARFADEFERFFKSVVNPGRGDGCPA